MLSHLFSIRAALLACTLLTQAMAADPIRIVFQNGRGVDISAVALQGDTLSITQSVDGFTAGQKFPLATADHIFGDKPAEMNPAMALLLTGKPRESLKLLEPIVATQKVTAKIPGNFWLDAARAALVAYAMEGEESKATAIGKDISEATAEQGNDPFIALGKVLLMPTTTKVEERETAYLDLTTDNQPADLAAYASFFRAELLKAAKRDAEALEAYLKVPCVFPSGGLILNAVAELNAAEYLAAQGRREEAVALLKSSIRQSSGTSVSAEANKRLESLK